MQKTKTACLIGATGLIGSHILDLLTKDSYFGEIRVIVRRPIDINHPKVKLTELDFEDLEALEKAIAGSDALFCAIGTTRAKTPDLNAYRKIDVDIPVNVARIGKACGAESFQLVSSVGANSQSRNFYLKMKGIVEDELIKTAITSTSIFRPSLLLGERKSPRPAEKIAAVLMRLLRSLIPDNQKPIEAKTVAKAMIESAKKAHPGHHITHYREMMDLSQ